MASTLTVEQRLQQLEVYLPETLKDLEVRLGGVEELLKNVPVKEIIGVTDKLNIIDAQLKQIPSGLISNWGEIEKQMRVWQKEETERKDAVQAIWKRLDTMNNDMRKLQDNLKVSGSDSDNESAVESIRIKFAQDMKNIQAQFEDMGNKMQNVKPYDEGKSSRIEWEQRMKRADFNKPGGMTDGDKGFVKYAASIKRWGHKLHNEFTKILEMVEGGKEWYCELKISKII